MTKSIQKELNSFFAKLQNKNYSILSVTKGALTQARAKLKPEAFVELSNLAVEEFYKNENYTKWNGLRLLAIDGSISNLPLHSSVKEKFGENLTGCHCSVRSSMARISLLYDVLNCITLEGFIKNTSWSEYNLMKLHLQTDTLVKGDLLLVDRAYPSNELMYDLKERGIEYCVRMRNNWNEVKDFASSSETSRTIKIPLNKTEERKLKRNDLNAKVITCRLVAIILDTGEKEILCTSLIDEEKYTIELLKELYHKRWNIEEAYKLLKVRLQLSNYSGKTANAVEQDFFAKLFMMNICSIMSFPIEEKIKEESKISNNKHKQQLNKTTAISTLKEGWVSLWINRKAKQVLDAFDKILAKTKEVVRLNRREKRKNYNYREAKPSPPYKRI